MSRVLKSILTEPEGLAEIPVTDVVLPQREPSTPQVDEKVQGQAHDLIRQTEERCKAMLEQAQQERAQVLEAAHSEVEAAKTAGYEAGYGKGFAAGEQAVRSEMQAYMDEQTTSAQNIMRQARVRYETALMSMNTVVASVVSEGLRTLLQRELALAPADIEKVSFTMLESIVEASRVEIHVNPAEFEEATAKHGQWLTQSFGEWPVTVIPDADISAGGCVVQTPHGRADGKMETRLELVDLALKRLLEGRDFNEVEPERTE